MVKTAKTTLAIPLVFANAIFTIKGSGRNANGSKVLSVLTLLSMIMGLTFTIISLIRKEKTKTRREKSKAKYDL